MRRMKCKLLKLLISNYNKACETVYGDTWRCPFMASCKSDFILRTETYPINFSEASDIDLSKKNPLTV
jgi:hypothetical protein